MTQIPGHLRGCFIFRRRFFNTKNTKMTSQPRCGGMVLPPCLFFKSPKLRVTICRGTTTRLGGGFVCFEDGGLGHRCGGFWGVVVRGLFCIFVNNLLKDLYQYTGGFFGSLLVNYTSHEQQPPRWGVLGTYQTSNELSRPCLVCSPRPHGRTKRPSGRWAHWVRWVGRRPRGGKSEEKGCKGSLYGKMEALFESLSVLSHVENLQERV